jgi:hypothetical protein
MRISINPYVPYGHTKFHNFKKKIFFFSRTIWYYGHMAILQPYNPYGKNGKNGKNGIKTQAWSILTSISPLLSNTLNGTLKKF